MAIRALSIGRGSGVPGPVGPTGPQGPAGSTRMHAFTASGLWVVPAGVTRIVVDCWGAGAGGFSDALSHAGGGGGAYTRATAAVTPGQVLTATLGDAGSGGSGFKGGDTTVKSPAGLLCRARGGGAAGHGAGCYLGGQPESAPGDAADDFASFGGEYGSLVSAALDTSAQVAAYGGACPGGGAGGTCWPAAGRNGRGPGGGGVASGNGAPGAAVIYY